MKVRVGQEKLYGRMDTDCTIIHPPFDRRIIIMIIKIVIINHKINFTNTNLKCYGENNLFLCWETKAEKEEMVPKGLCTKSLPEQVCLSNLNREW